MHWIVYGTLLPYYGPTCKICGRREQLSRFSEREIQFSLNFTNDFNFYNFFFFSFSLVSAIVRYFEIDQFKKKVRCFRLFVNTSGHVMCVNEY